MYAVTGATGNTGSVVAETLLDAGEQVRLLVRSPAKAKHLAAKGADVVAVDLWDVEAMTEALEHTTGAYLMLPPGQESGFLAKRQALAEVYAKAVAASGVPHVVALSSVAAQHAEGTGIIRTAHVLERTLSAVDVPHTFIRASYFVENWASVIAPARQDGVLPSTIGTATIPMVSVKDIGRVAAEALLSPAKDARIVELAGPEEASAADVAKVLGALLGRTVQPMAVPLDEQQALFQSFGFSEEVASLFRGMNQGIQDGTVAFEGTPIRGRVGLRDALAALI